MGLHVNRKMCFLKRFNLFIHERPRQRGRNIGRGRSRLPVGGAWCEAPSLDLGSRPRKAYSLTDLSLSLPPSHPFFLLPKCPGQSWPPSFTTSSTPLPWGLWFASMLFQPQDYLEGKKLLELHHVTDAIRRLFEGMMSVSVSWTLDL